MKNAPSCTYRIQLSPEFGFRDVAGIAAYLGCLGISHVYLSPVLQAAAGSSHGYDVVDPAKVNEELGGDAGFKELIEVLSAEGLGVMIDIVPNHMTISGPENRWWQDVLENGPSSAYAAFFDVEWEGPEAYLKNRIMLPVLEDQYGRVLEAGLINVRREGSRLFVTYRDHVFPVAPRSMKELLLKAGWRCASEKLQFFGEALGNLPLPTATDLENTRRRHRNKEVIFQFLEGHLAENLREASVLDDCIDELNGDISGLDGFLEKQNYRLAWWEKSREDLGYRRFFDINSLIALRVEDEVVFAETHRLPLQWIASKAVDGLRIDHIDGLRDPAEYLQRLHRAAPDAWIVVEKILEPGERFRGIWPVHGTTGYDFLNIVNGLFVEPGAEGAMTRLYREITGQHTDSREMVFETKLQVADDLFGSDFYRLTHLAMKICENRPRFRDSSRSDVMKIIKTLAATFDVYRTYFTPWRESEINEQDRIVMEQALSKTRKRLPDVDPKLLDLFGNLFLEEAKLPEETEFVARFQQLTGPLAAKGLEDTLFYCYNRFISLNEVGGEPSIFSVNSVKAHSFMEMKAMKSPMSMNTLATHDTKRSGDVRARLALLSEMPETWADAVERWSRMNEALKTGGMPDANMEYFLYQTMVGAWPLSLERLRQVIRKAAREAKTHTSWTEVNEAYEKALMGFLEALFKDQGFMRDFSSFVDPLIRPGRTASLAQTLLLLTAPGVPDIYQGTETWDLSLVDPDNRRAVDFEARKKLLDRVKDSSAGDVLGHWEEGMPKLWLISKMLAFRRKAPELFGPDAGYFPLETRGKRKMDLFAFGRKDKLAVVVPIRFLSGGQGMKETEVSLPEGGHWRHILCEGETSGGWTSAEELFSSFPVAALVREERGECP
ncbi:MAG: malto-oligosyltrehalose synthase [Thermovirgaceae bacterium]